MRLAAAFVLLAACSMDSAPTDAGLGDADAAAPDGGVESPVDIPWLEDGAPPVALPSFMPCPGGWQAAARDAVTICEPYPEAGPDDCGPGEAHFPGSPRCQVVGEACPAGRFSTSLPTDGSVVYVDGDASPGGDGSLGAPHLRLADVALGAIPPGTTIALAKGRYPGDTMLSSGVRLVGACATETAVVGWVRVSGGEEAEVMGLTLTGGSVGAWVEEGATLSLRGVIIEGTRQSGTFSEGVGAELSLTDVVIRDILGQADGTLGEGIVAVSGARVDASRVAIVRSRSSAVFVSNPGTEVTLTDVIAQETLTQASDGRLGEGFSIEDGTLTATRTLVVDSAFTGIHGRGPDTRIVLDDVIISGTGSNEGRGISLSGGPRLDASQLLVEGGRGSAGLFVTDGVLNLSDMVIRDTDVAETPGEGEPGEGIYIDGSVQLNGTRLYLADNQYTNIMISGEDAQATLTDIVLRDTRTGGPDGEARELNVQRGATVELSRASIERSETGLYVNDATVVTNDLAVRTLHPSIGQEGIGKGIVVQDGGGFDGNRLLIEDAQEGGMTSRSGARVVLRDVVIDGIGNGACDCPPPTYGHAAAAIGGIIDLERFLLANASGCGVLVARHEGASELAPSVDLRSGVVSGASVGACVQEDGYDLSRLTSDVQYRDNGTNLDATMLPVPDPAPARPGDRGGSPRE